MFNLEKSIADWRQQMLAAGIQTPVPLEELEIHLREEIEMQMKSGLNEQNAFKVAARQIGRASALKNEFRKTIMKAEYISRKFINRMLVIFSTTSVVMLILQFRKPKALDATTLASFFKSDNMSLLNLDLTFGGGADRTNFVRACLIVSLILTALFALLNFRLMKPSHK